MAIVATRPAGAVVSLALAGAAMVVAIALISSGVSELTGWDREPSSIEASAAAAMG